MAHTLTSTHTIQVGDTVAYKLSGTPVPEAQGKVIGLLKTQDGKTLADVQWDKLGPPLRLDVRNLIRIGRSDFQA